MARYKIDGAIYETVDDGPFDEELEDGTKLRLVPLPQVELPTAPLFNPLDPGAEDPDISFEDFRQAIIGQESGDDYEAVNARTGAYGRYQIMPENWAAWAQEAGLTPDAEKTPENQDVVATYKLRQYFDKYGARGAAIAWYGGEGALSYSHEARSLPQGNGDEPSINEYADSVLSRARNRITHSALKSVGSKVIDRMESYSREMVGEELRQLYGSFRQSDPDQNASDLKLAEKSGIPVWAIQADEENRKAVQDLVSQQENHYDWELISQENPVVADILRDPRYMSAAHDDVAALSAIEWLFDGFRRNYASGERQVEISKLGMQQLMGDESVLAELRLAQLEAEEREHQEYLKKEANGFWWSPRQLLTGFGAIIPQWEMQLKRGLQRGAQGATAGALAGAAVGLVLGPGGATISAGGAASAGFTAGLITGAAESAIQMEAGAAYREFSQMRDETGRPMDKRAARAAAMLVGAANGALEFVQMANILKALPGGQRLLTGLTRETVKDMLRNKGTRDALMRLVGETAVEVGKEVGVEVLQESVTVAGGELAKGLSDQYFESASMGEVVSRLGETAIESVPMFLVPGAIGPARNFAGRLRAARQAESNVAFMDSLASAVKNSKAAQRLPEIVQAEVEKLTQGGPIETVYIAPEAWNVYWQSKDVDPAAVAQEIGVAEAYKEAVETGNEIAIPTAVYAARIAPTEHYNALRSDLRLGADAMTEREAKEFNARVEQYYQETVQQVSDAIQEEVNEQKAASGVRETIKAQLLAVGRPEAEADAGASLLAAYAAKGARRWSAALKRGVTPEEWLERTGLEIKNLLPEQIQGNRLHQYAGTAALTADRLQLANAQELASQGVDNETIRQQTGWFRGMDGKWRFEIDDSKAKLIDAENLSKGLQQEASKLIKQAKKAKDAVARDQLYAQADSLIADIHRVESPVLSNVLDHQDLYKAYPWLAQIKVIVTDLSEGERGRYDPSSNTILLNKNLSPGDKKQVLLHEVQHVVQVEEGFAQGGSPQQFKTNLDVTNRELLKLQETLQGILNERPEYRPRVERAWEIEAKPKEQRTDAEQDELDDIYDTVYNATGEWGKRLTETEDAIKRIGETGVILTPFEQYQRLAGEIEARDTASRADLTAEERRQKAPDLRSDAIVVWGGQEFNYRAEQQITPEENIRRGTDAIQHVRDTKSDVQNAMFRPETGWIEFVWGNEGTAEKQYEDGFGIAKILTKHGEADLQRIPEVLAKGTAELSKFNDRVYFTLDDMLAVVRLTWNGNKRTWLLTGFSKQQNKKPPVYPADDGPAGTTLNGRSSVEGAEAFLNNNIPQSGQLFQSGKEKRGFIAFDPVTGAPTISLFNADASTFAHEAFHLFLQDFSRLASMPEVDAETKADWETIKNYLGVTADQVQPDGSVLLTEEQHEKWARSGEAYLLEGKAPSMELRNVFRRIRKWLLDLYKSVANLNVQLTPEVREVMDRMLALEEEIQAAQMEHNARAILSDKDMTADELTEYLLLEKEAQAETEEAIMEYLVGKMTQERKEELRRERLKVRAQVEQELRQEPLWKAIIDMGRSNRDPESVKLSTQWLVETYGEDILNTIPENIHAKNSPFGLNDVADLYGFSSADELLKAIQAARPLKEEINARVEAIMATKDTTINPLEIRKEAMKAVYGPKRLQLLAAESMNMHDQMMGRQVSKQQAKQFALAKAKGIERIAKSMIAKKPLVAATDTSKYIADAKRAGAASLQAYEKGNLPEARKQKDLQMLNHAMAMESIRVKRESDKQIAYLKRQQKKSQKEWKIPAEYVDQISAILARFGMPRRGWKDNSDRVPLQTWVKTQEAKCNIAAITPLIQREDFAKPYIHLTHDQLNEVYTAVRNINTMGRMDGKLLTVFKDMELQELVDLLVESAERNVKLKVQGRFEKRGDFEKWLAEAKAELIKPETLLRYLDGFADDGIWQQALYKIFNDAYNRELRRGAKAVEDIKKIVEQYYSRKELSKFDEKVYVEAIGDSLTKREIIGIALNWGNEGNQQRIMSGHKLNKEQVEAILDVLSEKDWKFVQALWNYVDTFWPEIEALEKRLVGAAPQKVEAVPVETKYGVFTGGYWPIMYDPDASIEASAYAEEMHETYKARPVYRAATRHGHTQARVETVERKVRLDFDQVLSNHITNVIHDLTHREAVIDAVKILNHKEIKDILQQSIGIEGYRALDKWIKRIASDQTEYFAGRDKAIRRLRFGATIAIMGGSLGTAIAQLTGFFSAMHVIGLGRGLSAIMGFYHNPAEWKAKWQLTQEKSAFMAERAKLVDRDVRDFTKRTFEGNNPVQRFAFALIGGADMMVSVPLWLEAYQHFIKENADTGLSNLEQAAVDYADGIVRRTQGSGAMKDLASVQNGPEVWKMFTMFYSYWNTWFQLAWESKRKLKSWKDVPQFISFLTLAWLTPTIVETAVREALKSGDDDDDDPDKLIRTILSNLFSTPFNSVPILRDAMPMIFNALFNTPGNVSMRMSPVSSGFEAMRRAIDKAQKGIEQDEYFDAARAVSEAAAYFVPFPQQFNRIFWNTLDEIMNGEEYTWNQILFGKNKR